jgi:NDP-sugar pyrophosphorylase family protein
MERRAVILAGGKGRRLLPYTTTLPKPLVPIGEEVAIVEILLRQLARHGFTRATLAIGHLGGLIQAYCGDGSQWGVALDYAAEQQPLGTIGPVVAIRETLPEHFLVMNGDILTDLDFGLLLEQHASSDAPITVATYERRVHVDFGVIERSADRIIGFSEKPTLDYAVSMGIYGMSRSTLEAYRPGEPIGFDGLMHDLLARGEHPAAFPYAGYWLDIGRPEDYERANAEWDRVRPTILGDP